MLSRCRSAGCFTDRYYFTTSDGVADNHRRYVSLHFTNERQFSGNQLIPYNCVKIGDCVM